MDRLLTTREVCDLLRISYPTLNRWMNDGRFVTSVGRGKLLFDPDTVEAWIKNQQTPPIPASTTTSPTKRKSQEKDAKRRAELARQALDRHAAGRKTKCR